MKGVNMNNFNWLKSFDDAEALGRRLCDCFEMVADCDKCPFNDKCIPFGGNGFTNWLLEDTKEKPQADKEAIKTVICDQYCIYRNAKHPKYLTEFMQAKLEEKCENCPLNKL